MSINVLQGKAQHEPSDDLESFFYVLIWMCIHYAGPGQWREGYKHNKAYLNWIKGQSLDDIADHKRSAIINHDTFKDRISSQFSPYFRDLVPCINELRVEIAKPYREDSYRDLPADKFVTHGKMVEILNNAYGYLPDREVWSAENDPEGYGISKRKRIRSDLRDYKQHATALLEPGRGDGIIRTLEPTLPSHEPAWFASEQQTQATRSPHSKLGKSGKRRKLLR
jgi:hypothetical protein